MTPFSAFRITRYGRGFSSREAIQAWQAHGMARLRQKIMPLSPFYARYAESRMADWPIMTKALLMEHFSEINTCGIDRDAAMALALKSEETRNFEPMMGEIAVGLSTGTSGQRGLFLTSRHERALWAAVICGRFWPFPLLQRQRVGFFMRADNALYRRVANPLLKFHFFDLLNPFSDNMVGLQKLQPSILVAPATMLAQIARAQQRNQIGIAPKRLISVAEVLSPEDSACIETVFGRQPDQVYQATEGLLAYSCRAGNLHLNERFVKFDRDVLDSETGAFCPIVTDFTRSSLPILRYRLDDVLFPDPEPCPCGGASQRIARIEGRADDILWWQGHDGKQRLIASDLLRQMVATLPVPVRDYRVIAEEELLTVWLDTSLPEIAFPALRSKFETLAQQHSCILPELKIRRGLPVETGAKRRRVTVIRR